MRAAFQLPDPDAAPIQADCQAIPRVAEIVVVDGRRHRVVEVEHHVERDPDALAVRPPTITVVLIEVSTLAG